MALPPIIANNPLVKALKTESSSDTPPPAKGPEGGSLPQDVVEISSAAVQRLEESRQSEISSQEQARETAVETRSLLEESGASLGLDSEFS